jgi:predicted ATPase with chaperone activity
MPSSNRQTEDLTSRMLQRINLVRVIEEKRRRNKLDRDLPAMYVDMARRDEELAAATMKSNRSGAFKFLAEAARLWHWAGKVHEVERVYRTIADTFTEPEIVDWALEQMLTLESGI